MFVKYEYVQCNPFASQIFVFCFTLEHASYVWWIYTQVSPSYSLMIEYFGCFSRCATLQQLVSSSCSRICSPTVAQVPPPLYLMALRPLHHQNTQQCHSSGKTECLRVGCWWAGRAQWWTERPTCEDTSWRGWALKLPFRALHWFSTWIPSRVTRKSNSRLRPMTILVHFMQCGVLWPLPIHRNSCSFLLWSI